MQCSYIRTNDRGEGKGGGGEKRGGREDVERWRLGWEGRGRRERRGIGPGWSQWNVERGEMREMIRGWEEASFRGKRGGGEGGITEKSVGALHTEKKTRGGRVGMGVEERGIGEGPVYLSSRYFGNMDSVLQAASLKVQPAMTRT